MLKKFRFLVLAMILAFSFAGVVHADRTFVLPPQGGHIGQFLQANGTFQGKWAAAGSGTIGGTIAAGQVGYGSALNTLTSDAFFTRDPITQVGSWAVNGATSIVQNGDQGVFHFVRLPNGDDVRLLLNTPAALGKTSIWFGNQAGHYGSETGQGRNTGFGNRTGSSITSGTDNTLFGNDSGLGLTSGIGNTIIGEEAGFSINGNYNFIGGYQAAQAAGGGAFTVALGYQAGFNSLGSNSVLIGEQTGVNNTANGSVFLGGGAGFANTSGARNTFVGFSSGSGQSTASDLTYVGYQAGVSNGSTGQANTGFGSNVMFNTTTGDENAAFGYESGISNILGGLNTYIGSRAGRYQRQGSNTAIGAYALAGNSTPASNTGDSNTAVGYQAGFINSSGVANTFLGTNAGVANTSGHDQTFVGAGAGAVNGGAINNTYIGSSAGGRVNGSDNVVIGDMAGYGAVGSSYGRSVILGNFAGQGLTNQSNNVLIGFNAGNALTGGNNLFIGYEAGAQTQGVFSNSFFGYHSGYNNLTGANNMFQGALSGNDNTTGSFNICMGDNSCTNSQTGSGLVMLGSGTSVSANGFSDSIALGRDTQITASNQLLVGSATHPILSFKIGDHTISANGTSVLGNDTAKTLVMQTNGRFSVTDTSGNDYIISDISGHLVQLGNSGSWTSNLILNQTSGVSILGDGFANGSNTIIKADDNTQKYTLNKLGGGGTQLVTTDNAGILGTTALTTLASGTYTPTLTNGVNVTSSVSHLANWTRLGNVVTVSGQIDITPTGISAQTEVKLSLPVASNLTSGLELNGVAQYQNSTVIGPGGTLVSDTVGDKADLTYFTTTVGAGTMVYTFSYPVQ